MIQNEGEGTFASKKVPFLRIIADILENISAIRDIINFTIEYYCDRKIS